MAASETSPSIRQYSLTEEIGQGSFGSVFMAFDTQLRRLVAMKIIPKTEEKENSRLRQEVAIMRHIRHGNIIQLYESFEDSSFYYLCMEFAEGGELFDKILPDIGVEEDLAHFYFNQLIAGVEYLHSLGVAHRDLKPENLLLDKEGNLRIADFGLATMFRTKSKERRLHTLCGTKPYVAPNVIFQDYDGPLSDIWSTGVILFVLICGNTPWEEPTENSPEFVAYSLKLEQVKQTHPWCRFRYDVLDLVIGILNVNEKKRMNIALIKQHKWFRRKNPMLAAGKCADPDMLATRLLHNLVLEEPMAFSQVPSSYYTQLTQQATQHDANTYAFSQPIQFANNSEFLRSQHHQIDFSQPDTAATTGVKLSNERLTRFYCHCSIEVLMDRLVAIFTEFVVAFNRLSLCIQFQTVDKRKCPLTGEIQFQNLPQQQTVFVNFRKGQGDPLEFKRFYQAIKEELSDLISI